MKILGIGNAIVNVICKIDENFISQNNLSKGSMKLIFDEVEFKKILSSLKVEKTISGGSVANSIVGLSQLNNKVGFIGKVADDDFGGEYEKGLKKEITPEIPQKNDKITLNNNIIEAIGFNATLEESQIKFRTNNALNSME